LTYLHKIKCLSCSLHFTACSYDEDWRPVSCPECTARFDTMMPYMHWVEPTDKQIFQFVPGDSGMKEIVGVLRTPSDAGL
jgi:hypothetical protein